MSAHLQREIERLKKKILSISARVEAAIQDAVRSLKNRDPALAEKVIEGDAEIDRIEVEMEEDCLKVLALYQPVAADLRYVVAVLKINNDLERIGDQAVNIAERAEFLATQKRLEFPGELTLMLEKAQAMLRKSLDALINQDAVLAREVIAQDDEVDDLNRKMYSLIQSCICKEMDQLACFIAILSVSRQLERIADQVTNIAEDIVYLVEGEIVRHAFKIE